MNIVILQMTEVKGETRRQLCQRSKVQIETFTAAGFSYSVVMAYGASEAQLTEWCRDADALYCHGNPPITASVLQACKQLKLVQRSGIGVDSIDLEAASRLGIPVQNVVGYCVEELAVHATALILSNLRTILFYDRAIRDGQWPKGKGREPRRCSTLTLGIFGLGGSGKNMARIWGAGFGSRLIAYDPYVTPDAAKAMGVELVDFETFCRQSDLISIHAPLTRDTWHAFDDAAFAMMRPNCILVNTSRGPIVDEAALARAQKTGRIAAAGIDTFETEPLPADSPLIALADRTALTPHSAFCGVESKRALARIASDLVVSVLRDRTVYLPYLVNREVLPGLQERGYAVRRELMQ